MLLCSPFLFVLWTFVASLHEFPPGAAGDVDVRATRSLLSAVGSGGAGTTAVGEVVELTLLQPNVPQKISVADLSLHTSGKKTHRNPPDCSSFPRDATQWRVGPRSEEG